MIGDMNGWFGRNRGNSFKMDAEGRQKRFAHVRYCRWRRLVARTKKAGILILSSTVGTAIGYGIYLFVSLGLLALYGDDGQGGHPTKFLENSLFYGVFGITTLVGFGLGLFIVKKWEKSAS